MQLLRVWGLLLSAHTYTGSVASPLCKVHSTTAQPPCSTSQDSPAHNHMHQQEVPGDPLPQLVTETVESLPLFTTSLRAYCCPCCKIRTATALLIARHSLPQGVWAEKSHNGMCWQERHVSELLLPTMGIDQLQAVRVHTVSARQLRAAMALISRRPQLCTTYRAQARSTTCFNPGPGPSWHCRSLSTTACHQKARGKK